MEIRLLVLLLSVGSQKGSCPQNKRRQYKAPVSAKLGCLSE